MSQPSVDPDLAWALRLHLVPGVGPRIRRALLDRFGTPQQVFTAAPSELREIRGVGPKVCRAITDAVEEDGVEPELDLCRRNGISLLSDRDAAYPRMLREIPDPPGLLYIRGELRECDAVAIAIVGSRHATRYGLTQAERLAASLARAGFTIVSGLARGIDAAAHRGALEAGGRTIAVLGCGLAKIYPPEHKELAERVVASGALVSECPVMAEPLAGNFPQRNRLISGLSLGALVVEAAAQSGALSTAKHAREQGREVFAVPGRIDSRMSHGCHLLIRDGARLVESADDVLEELGPLVAPVKTDDGRSMHHPAEVLLNEIERQVLQAVRSDATLVDEIIEESKLAGHQVLATLTVLEMRRLVRRISGSAYIRL